MHQIPQAIAQLEAVALALLANFKGGVAVGVIGHQGNQGDLGLLAADGSNFGEFLEGERPAFQIENCFHPGR